MPGARGTPEILPARDRRAVPWKNGGGVTREIAVSPPGAPLSDFEWRISTAEITCPGPFSLFPGVDRSLSVLEGELDLSLAAAAPVRLSVESAPFAFAGDVPARGEPRRGAVTDLNVMTRRGRFAARVSRMSVTDAGFLTLGVHVTVLFALAAMRLEVAGVPFSLSRWDAACFSGSSQCTLEATSAPEAVFYVIEIAPPI